MPITRDDLGTIEQGETAHPFEHEFQDSEGNPLDLSAASVPQARMVNTATGVAVFDWQAATFATPRTLGLLQYFPVAGDVATAGSFTVQFRYTTADTTLDYSPPLTLTIRASP